MDKRRMGLNTVGGYHAMYRLPDEALREGAEPNKAVSAVVKGIEKSLKEAGCRRK
jgi:hypothetical protein